MINWEGGKPLLTFDNGEVGMRGGRGKQLMTLDNEDGGGGGQKPPLFDSLIC